MIIKGSLHIESSRIDESGEEEKSVSIVEASQERDGQALVLRYQEPVENQMEETITTLRWEGDVLELVREGYVNMQMRFVCDEASNCRYTTQGLCLDLVVETELLEVAMKDGWIEAIDLHYSLEMEAEMRSHHLLKLHYSK